MSSPIRNHLKPAPGSAPRQLPAKGSGGPETALLKALAAQDNPNRRTAAVMAKATDLGYSTVTRLLSGLEGRGLVRREKLPRHNGKAQPDRWHLANAEDTGPADASDTAADATPVAPTAPDVDPTPAPDISAAPALEATNGPDAATPPPGGPISPAEPAQPASGPSAPAPAPTPTTPSPTPTPDGPTPTRPGEDTATAATPARLTGNGQPRLRPGGLREQVLAHLTARPGRLFTAGEIARALGGRSAGAVANALDKLHSDGRVQWAPGKPRKACVSLTEQHDEATVDKDPGDIDPADPAE